MEFNYIFILWGVFLIMVRIVGKGLSFDDVLSVPKYNEVVSRKDVDFKTRITKNYEIDIPILAANMDTVCESEMAITLGKLGGVGVIHRFMEIEDQAKEVFQIKQENLLCAAAVGIKDYKERTAALINSGLDILVLDVAHAHCKRAGEALKWIKYDYPHLDVMVGNIATKEAAEYFLERDADALKVGIGPGSMCTTRIMTGAGIPQLTAIMNVYEITKGKIPICGDGGIKEPGDVAKAIGAGADNVMFGSIFSGTKETPGDIYLGQKEYRGMASYEASLKKLELDGEKHKEDINVEGERIFVDYKGPIEPIVKKFLVGFASGMTYVGAKNIEEICGEVDFIEISRAGKKESIAHGLKD